MVKTSRTKRVSKSLKRINFLKTSIRSTITVEKTSDEKRYFDHVKKTQALKTNIRDAILQQHSNESIVQCPKCKKRQVEFRSVMTRRADEDPTKKCQCRNPACLYKFQLS